MILHHLPQTVKNNASKAEAPVRGIHSIVNLLRHHYSINGSWVSTLIIALIATLVAAVAILACRTRQQRGIQFVSSLSVTLIPARQASLFAARQDLASARMSGHLPAGVGMTWPALPALARRDGVSGAAASSTGCAPHPANCTNRRPPIGCGVRPQSQRTDIAVTAIANHDPIASMVTMPLRAFAAPAVAAAPRVHALSPQPTGPAPVLTWATQPHDGFAMAVPVVGSDRQLHRCALGLLLTVLLLGIPLAAYLASLT